jgi:hypothetical protein
MDCSISNTPMSIPLVLFDSDWTLLISAVMGSGQSISGSLITHTAYHHHHYSASWAIQTMNRWTTPNFFFWWTVAKLTVHFLNNGCLRQPLKHPWILCHSSKLQYSCFCYFVYPYKLKLSFMGNSPE